MLYFFPVALPFPAQRKLQILGFILIFRAKTFVFGLQNLILSFLFWARVFAKYFIVRVVPAALLVGVLVSIVIYMKNFYLLKKAESLVLSQCYEVLGKEGTLNIAVSKQVQVPASIVWNDFSIELKDVFDPMNFDFHPPDVAAFYAVNGVDISGEQWVCRPYFIETNSWGDDAYLFDSFLELGILGLKD